MNPHYRTTKAGVLLLAMTIGGVLWHADRPWRQARRNLYFRVI